MPELAIKILLGVISVVLCLSLIAVLPIRWLAPKNRRG